MKVQETYPVQISELFESSRLNALLIPAITHAFIQARSMLASPLA